MFVDGEVGKILKGVQCLTAFSNQNAHLSTFQFYVVYILFLCGSVDQDLNFQSHGSKYLGKEISDVICNGIFFAGFDFCRFTVKSKES